MSGSLFERMSDVQAPRAHARRSDPLTSHQAAEAVTPGLTALQRLVEQFAREHPEGFLDVELCARFENLGDSTMRTRRAELAARNLILDSMRRRKPDGATTPHTVWIHRQFVDGAPPLVEPEPPATNADREAGKAMAGELADGARQMRREGRTMFADQLDEAARLMRRLAQ